jgi:hypothetical protein
MEHTQEPWVVSRTSISGTAIDPIDPTDNFGKNIGMVCDRIHARRITAAVNACAGIPTELLEEGVIKKAMADFEMMRKTEIETMKNLSELRLENLELKTEKERMKAENERIGLKLEALEKAHSEGNLSRLVRERMDAEYKESEAMKNLEAVIGIASGLYEALKFCKSVIEGNGVFETSERLAVEKSAAAIERADNLISAESGYTPTEQNCKGCFGPCGECGEVEKPSTRRMLEEAKRALETCKMEVVNHADGHKAQFRYAKDLASAAIERINATYKHTLFVGTPTGIEDIDEVPQHFEPITIKAKYLKTNIKKTAASEGPNEPDYDNQAKDYDEDRRWEGAPTPYDQ